MVPVRRLRTPPPPSISTPTPKPKPPLPVTMPAFTTEPAPLAEPTVIAVWEPLTVPMTVLVTVPPDRSQIPPYFPATRPALVTVQAAPAGPRRATDCGPVSLFKKPVAVIVTGLSPLARMTPLLVSGDN